MRRWEDLKIKTTPRLWDIACSECEGKWDEIESPADFANGAEWAVGWCLAIVGMAEAIKKNAPRLVERSYWTTDKGEELYTCHCPGCGAYMKHLRAGEDEGTDNEWCGACRW